MCANWLCARRIGLGWAHNTFYIAYHMFMHFPCIRPLFLIYLLYLNYFGTFWLSLSLSPSLSICVSLCLWHLNASLLRPRTLFVLGHPLPLILLHHIFSFMMRMPERLSRRTFLNEAFILNAKSSWRTSLTPNVIHSRGWESLCDVLVICPSVLIQKFYSNMHGLDSSVPFFHTRVWGTHIIVTPELVSDVLHVLRVKHPDYPGCECLRIVSKYEMIFTFCEHPLIGVIVSLHHVSRLLKVLDSWTWWWLLFFTIFLTITLSQNLMLDFCFLC